MITKETVRKIAELSCLDLSLEEVIAYTEELNQILIKIEKLQGVKTEGLGLSSENKEQGVVREDVVTLSLPLQEVLMQGPEVVKGYFRVPKILEED